MKTKLFTLFAAVLIAANAMADTKTITVGSVSFDMIFVEGGTFTMGATEEQGSDAYEDEKPTHQVTLSDYYIGAIEVTQELWYAVMGKTPTEDGKAWSSSFGLGDDYPAYYISWDDCQSFITELNKLTGQTFRMPTEAEWEYAARGGNKSKGYKYSGGNTIDDVAWYLGNNGSSGTATYGSKEVRTKAANELGIYDMSGNMYEWCSDWYSIYSSSAQTNPTGPSSGSFRVRRGGGWGNSARGCRVSYRDSHAPSGRSGSIGLRLVLVPSYYTITATAGEGGTVTGSDTYEHGAEVTLEATPNEGYVFAGWSDGNAENPRTVTVTANATYTANFAQPEYVDLGLTSGTRWATFNVNAAVPEQAGGYYAWGETTTKSDYSWSTYNHCNGTYTTLTKYCNDSYYGTVDNKTVLEASDDAAHVNWGGDWRMPTLAEQEELLDECDWFWTTLNGVEGCRITGPNGNSIFLPAAGYRDGTAEPDYVGVGGGYWSSSLNESDPRSAYYFYFSSDNNNWSDYGR